MSESVSILMAAKDEGFDLSRLWIIIGIVFLSVVGNIAKKIKDSRQRRKEAEEGIERPPGRAPAPPQRRPAAPPRPPQAPRPTLVAGAPGARPIELSVPGAQWASLQPVPARRVRPARPAPPVLREPSLPGAPVDARRARPAQAVPAKPFGSDVAQRTLPTEVGRPAEVPKEAKARPRDRLMQAKLEQMLTNRSGLRAAIALSEILAPPLALRNDHLQR